MVKTDEIAGIDERSPVLRSGRQLEAGILITATGLQIQALFGAMHITVGGRPGLPQQQLTCRDCCSRACSTSPGSNHRHDIN